MNKRGTTLTERDTQLLFNLYQYRYLSSSQVYKILFPSLQTAYRRLRALLELKYIERFIAPTIPECLYFLTKRGAEIVARYLNSDISNLEWRRVNHPPHSYLYLEHFLRVNDFRIALTQACQSVELELLGFIPEFIPEHLEKKNTQGDNNKYIKDIVSGIEQKQPLSHTPDAVFALRKQQVSALFFLEIDCGTEVISKPEKGVLKGVQFYLNYLLSERYQRYQEDFQCSVFKGFRVLFVTISRKRLENMRQAISQLPFAEEQAKRFIWLTTYEYISVQTVLNQIWQSADLHDSTWYQIR